MTFGSLFAGIGGFDFGFERAGLQCAWQVEKDPWCRQVLAKHWPEVRRFEDVREFAIAPDSSLSVDVICGGFPCQDISNAGKREGIDGKRSGLWGEYARIVGVLRPRFVVVENVRALVGRGLSRVLMDLARLRYDAEWQIVSAAAFGAPHIRERLFLVAYPTRPRNRGLSEGSRTERKRTADPDGGREALAYPMFFGRYARRPSDAAKSEERRESDRSGIEGDVPDTNGQRLSFAGRSGEAASENGREGATTDGGGWWAVEPDVGRVAHGVPARVHRLRGLGNAVVPQVAEWIGRRLIEIGGAS